MKSKKFFYTCLVAGMLTLFVCFYVTLSYGQNAAYFDKVVTKEHHITPWIPTFQVSNTSVQLSVGGGSTTYYYWIVSTDSTGNKSQPFLAGSVSTAPSTYTTNNYATIYWQGGNGNVSFDVLRTTTNTVPSGTANYLVGTSTNWFLSDTGSALTSYTVGINNQDFVFNSTVQAGVQTLGISYGGQQIWSINPNSSASVTTPWFDPRIYGAKCDGATDDTTAFQTAITNAQAIGGMVLVPATSNGCVIASYLTISNKVRLWGFNYRQYTISSTIKFTGNGGGTCSDGTNGFLRIQTGGVAVEGIIFMVSNATAGTCIFNASNIGSTEISGLVFDKTVFNGGSGSSTNIGLFVDAADTVKLLDNIWANTVNMVYHGSTTNNGLLSFTVMYNTFTQCTTSTGYMIELSNNAENDSTEISDNVFEGSNTCNMGIHGSGVNASGGITIRSNWFGDAGSTNAGTWIFVSNGTIAGNRFQIPTVANSWAIKTQNNTLQASVITNNTISGNAFFVGDTIIQGNHFDGGGSHVQLQAGQNWSQGNEFESTAANSYTCFSGTCNLYYLDTADASTSGPASGVTILGTQKSQLPIPASLTTTAATSDAVSIAGLSTASHCSVDPTNASAATNSTTTYISAKAAGSITVTHTATAGMTYDILCTPN